MSTDEDYKKLAAAACNNDLDAVKAMLDAGFDKESIDQFEEPILSEIVFNLLEDAVPERYAIVKILITMGFNPQHLDSDRCGPLTQAMLSMDTMMLEVLLQGGAIANETAGFKEGETLYDWAVFDYIHQVWEVNQIPEEPSQEALADEDAWLIWLDEMALKYERRRPDHLLLLRKYGAETGVELKKMH